jgi:hypothetical protein
MVSLTQRAQVLRLRFPRSARGQSLGIVFVDALEQFDRDMTRFAALWITESAAINISPTA